MDKATIEKVTREIQIRDLSDIDSLRRNEAFNRFFLRRLTEMRDKAQKGFENDPMTHEAREVVRCQLKLIKEILGMLDADEAIIRKQLN